MNRTSVSVIVYAPHDDPDQILQMRFNEKDDHLMICRPNGRFSMPGLTERPWVPIDRAYRISVSKVRPQKEERSYGRKYLEVSMTVAEAWAIERLLVAANADWKILTAGQRRAANAFLNMLQMRREAKT